MILVFLLKSILNTQNIVFQKGTQDYNDVRLTALGFNDEGSSVRNWLLSKCDELVGFCF